MHAAVNVPGAQGGIAESQSNSMVDAIICSETAFSATAGSTHACAASASCANTSNASPARLRTERRLPRSQDLIRSDIGRNCIPDKICCAC